MDNSIINKICYIAFNKYPYIGKRFEMGIGNMFTVLFLELIYLS